MTALITEFDNKISSKIIDYIHLNEVNEIEIYQITVRNQIVNQIVNQSRIE